MRTTVTATASLLLALGLSALPAQAKQLSYQERLRAEAEHACYQDAKRLCDADIPDEAKVTACMARNQEALSPACRKVFDKGM